jgi:hypothetical protein
LPAELVKLMGPVMWEYESPLSAKKRTDENQPTIGAQE